MRIEKKDLGTLTLLGKGGFGQVFRVGGFRLPDDPVDLAYKEFTRDEDEQARNAREAVAFRIGLPPEVRADLDSCAVWPRALVEERGTTTGLLMPLLPDAFFCRMEDPDTGAKREPREMSWLATGAGQRAAVQLDLRDVGRLERFILLGKLTFAIGLLHKHGWVFGDISFRNAVFALDPPRVLLIDCDGAAPLSANRRQAMTPFWDPPECPPRGMQHTQDTYTDAYKLGVAALRCMTPGKGAGSVTSPQRLAGAMDARGIDIITRALEGKPAERPTARELYEYFYQEVAPHVRPPDVTMARLRNPFRVRGQEVRIDWQISGAHMVTVFTGAQRFEVDLSRHPDGYGFCPDESGLVAIEVANRFGALPFDLGEVTLYELPPINVDLNVLPTPHVPPLPTLPAETLDRAMAGAPAPRLPDIPVPTLDTSGLIGSLMKNAALTVPMPSLGQAMADAAAVMTTKLQDEANQISAQLRAAYQTTTGHTGI